MLKLPVDLFVLVVLFWNAVSCVDAALRGVLEDSLTTMTPLLRLDNDFTIYRQDHEDESELRSPEEMAADDELMARWDISSSTKGLLCIGCVTIDVVFHVFTDGQPRPENIPWWDRTTDELLTPAGIANQQAVLDRHFSKSPFKFNIRPDVRRVVDASLANALITDTAKLQQMRALRTGGSHVANIYWFRGYCNPEVDDNGVSVACGRATFPTSGGIFPDEMYWQGDFVYMCPLCMSNQAAWNVDAKTLSHEIGHWLGLYHTVRILYTPAALSMFVVTRQCCLI
jgi:hypothetical protein